MKAAVFPGSPNQPILVWPCFISQLALCLLRWTHVESRLESASQISYFLLSVCPEKQFAKYIVVHTCYYYYFLKILLFHSSFSVTWD